MLATSDLRWDEEVDVVVAGCGYSGARAAISAHDAGAEVLVLEKMSHPGGVSVMSGGIILAVKDQEAAREYFARLSGGRVSEEVLEAFVAGLAVNLSDVEKLAETVQAKFKVQDWGGVYQLAGRESLHVIFITLVPGFDKFPWFERSLNQNGPRLLKFLLDNMEARGIKMRLNNEAVKLLQDTEGQVCGLKVKNEQNQVGFIRARKGVILATGGFEFDEWAKLQYFEAQPVYAMGSLANSGDGLRMAQDVGARLWHMWHFHGSYGFKYPEFPMAFRHRFGGPRTTPFRPTPKMPWIVVDSYGKRFMDEFPSAPQDTSARPLALFDPERVEYPRIPCYLIFDEEGRKKGPIAIPIGYPEHQPSGQQYLWSFDNLEEVAKGWILAAQNLEDLAGKIRQSSANQERMNPGNLLADVNRWNGLTETGQDLDFGRDPQSMMSITEPPYYAMEAWPVVTNTQGGPEHDASQRVLGVDGLPIKGLYATGELGSFFGHLYELSGNIGECLSSGRIAGRNAVAGL